MKKLMKSVTTLEQIAAMGSSAWADGARGFSPQAQHRGRHGGSHGGDWIAPLLFIGLAGAVIGAAASQNDPPPRAYVAPPVTYVPQATYVAPAVVVPAAPPPPANMWYFCQSSGQYYPYTQRCPEGWQLVSPQPR